MLKVISENQIISENDIYNKVNSIEELVALTKVNNVYFYAYGTEDIEIGNDIEDIGAATLRVEEYCDNEGIEYDSIDTIERDTEKVIGWYTYCTKNGFTPYWFTGISYKHGYEFTECKKTTLKSDLYVGQKVWFAHGVDIREGEIAQVCLRTKSTIERHYFSSQLYLSLLSTGLYTQYPNRNVNDYLDKLENGYVLVKSKGLNNSCFNINNYNCQDKFHSYDCNYIILPLDKVYTKSPF